MSTIMMHLSRFSKEVIIWNSDKPVEIDDAYSTGSSIMPQKKNPDIAETLRGKTGRVYGALMSLLTTMKGIPLAYNKDMQEDKELSFDAIDTTKGCIALFTGMIDTMKFNKDVMRKSAAHGFTNAIKPDFFMVSFPFLSSLQQRFKAAFCTDSGENLHICIQYTPRIWPCKASLFRIK